MAKDNYDPSTIEPRWQQVWDEQRAFRTPDDPELLRKRPKYYVLDMFPYPSGAGLHIGHPEGYTATDVVARTKRMQGCNVLHPMGWDAFGLPAERAAVRANEHPAAITTRNIDNFRRQIKRLGFSYDWDREISTADPDYYRWTQWIYLKLFERDLAYMAEIPVWWCPALGTVLANEEVKDGKYVETDDPVERRMMRQWMLKITAYADRLLEDLEDLDWPEHVKEMQRNWIGKSRGALVTFPIADSDLSFDIFTTRPDTLFGATYCVLSPEHPLVAQITSDEQRDQVRAYVQAASAKSDLQRTDLDKDKSGAFTGAYAINPVNEQKIPIWIADYVLMSYGTGCIMAVPGQDQRDWDFAAAYDLPILRTVQPPDDFDGEAYVGDGPAIHSQFLDGLEIAEAKSKIIDWLEAKGCGTARIEYRLRDWLFSRQRYWGEPFPVVHIVDGEGAPTGEIVSVPTDQLPVELPNVDEYKPTEDGRPPLARAGDDWLMVELPDGRRAVRETNTMPQWAGSCWYYLRYIDPHNTEAAFSAEAESYWMPVDLYIGGVEHAVLHLLYSRFWHKVLFDCGLVSTKEPFQCLFNQGMILAYSYQDAGGRYYSPEDVEERDERYFARDSGVELTSRIEKMGKSKLNVTNPDDVIDEYGADALRLYELFMGPLDQQKPWQTRDVEGVYRFLQRVWRLVIDVESGELSARLTTEPGASEVELWRLLHKTIEKVGKDVDALSMNTAISQMMIFTNAATGAKSLPREIVEIFLRVLSPWAPHLAEELWHRLGREGLVCTQEWPQFDPALVVDETINLVVQINGKKRDVLECAKDTPREELEKLALASEGAVRFLDGKTPRRVIVVPGRLVNIVV